MALDISYKLFSITSSDDIGSVIFKGTNFIEKCIRSGSKLCFGCGGLNHQFLESENILFDEPKRIIISAIIIEGIHGGGYTFAGCLCPDVCSVYRQHIFVGEGRVFETIIEYRLLEGCRELYFLREGNDITRFLGVTHEDRTIEFIESHLDNTILETRFFGSLITGIVYFWFISRDLRKESGDTCSNCCSCIFGSIDRIELAEICKLINSHTHCCRSKPCSTSCPCTFEKTFETFSECVEWFAYTFAFFPPFTKSGE